MFMPPGGWGFGPNYAKVEPPKNIKDVPRYLRELLSGFFSRFAYIIALVWKTGWWILFSMAIIALLQGVTPVISSVISRNILNALQMSAAGQVKESFWGSEVFYLLMLFFLIQALTRVIGTVSGAINRIAGEKVVRQVKTQIMEKSREIDLASFDQPAFYEKLENAKPETDRFRFFHSCSS